MRAGAIVMRTVLLSGLLSACSVGEVASPGPGMGTGMESDAATSAACVDRIVPAVAAHNHGGVAGATNAGMACLVAGCHLAVSPGAGAPGYQFAGTLYKPDGAPNAGAVIRVKSSMGMEVMAYTDAAGNFAIAANSIPGNPFPATTNATACPKSTPMATPLTTGGGNCNSAGCHAANMRMTLDQ